MLINSQCDIPKSVQIHTSVSAHKCVITQRGKATTKLTTPQSPPSQRGDKGEVKYLTYRIQP